MKVVGDDRTMSTIVIVTPVGVPYDEVTNILRQEQYHPHHDQLIQSSQPGDHQKSYILPVIFTPVQQKYINKSTCCDKNSFSKWIYP